MITVPKSLNDIELGPIPKKLRQTNDKSGDDSSCENEKEQLLANHSPEFSLREDASIV